MDVYQRRRLVALSAIAGVFIIFVLLIRSCGGDDEEPQPLAAGASGASGVAGPTVLAQVDYIAQADSICLEANTSFASVDESDPVQADNDRAEILAGELQQLQTLPPPDAATEDLDKFLGALQTQSAAYQDRATASERGDDAQVVELDATIDEADADAAKAARAFGFNVCGDLSKVGDTSDGGGGGGGGGGEDVSEPSTDTGGTVTPTEPVTPATTTPVPVEPPPTDTAGGGTATPAPPAPTEGTDTGGDAGSGGVSP